jgi:hypothetical protein
VLNGGQGIEYPKCFCIIVCCVCEWLYHTAGIQCVSVDGVIITVGKLGRSIGLLIIF